MSESSYLPKTLTTPPKTPPPPPSSSSNIPSEDSLDYSQICGLELDPSGQILNLNSSPPPKSPPNLLPHLAESSSAEDEEDGFPLANDESEEVSDLDSDVVIYSSSTLERRRKWTRPAMLLALLALLALAIALGVTSNNRGANTATILSSSTKAKDKAPPAPKPASPPKKEGSDDTEALLTPYPTDNVGGMTKSNMPTVVGTVTVSTEVSAPPTVADRIVSPTAPTWRG